MDKLQQFVHVAEPSSKIDSLLEKDNNSISLKLDVLFFVQIFKGIVFLKIDLS
jgi:hypothetical protein